MKAVRLVDNNLQLSIDAEEKNKFFEASINEDFDSDMVMCDLFEEFLSNSEYEWVDPKEIEALTTTPILGILDEDGDVLEAWGFMGYEVVSLQRQLLDKGWAILQAG